VANEYVGDVTIPTQIIMYNQCCSRRISQSDCSIHIKLNYFENHMSLATKVFHLICPVVTDLEMVTDVICRTKNLTRCA